MALSATPAVEIEFDAGVWTDVAPDSQRASWDRGRSFELDSFRAARGSVTLKNADRKYDPEHAGGTYYGKLLPRKRIRIGFTYNGTTYWKFTGYIDGWPQAYDGPNLSTVTVTATDAFKVFAGARVPSPWQQLTEAAATTTARYRLGEASGTSAADASGNGLHGTYSGGATFNARTSLVFGDSDGAIGFDGVDDHVDLPFGAAVDTNGSWSIEFWIEKSNVVDEADDEIIFEQSQGQPTDAPGVVSILVRGVGTNDGQLSAALISSGSSALIDSGVRVDDGAKHHGVVTADGSTLRMYVDGTLVGSDNYTALASSVSWLRIGDGRIGSGDSDPNHHLDATLDEFIIHNDALSDGDVADRYEAGTNPWAGDTAKARIERILDYIAWLAGDRDLDDGSASLIAASLETDALSHLQAVELSEGGRFFIDRTGRATLIGRQNFWTEAVYNASNATFGDSGSELKYAAVRGDLFGYDDEKIINEARVRQHGGSEQVAYDATSADPTTGYGLMSRSEQSFDARPGVVRDRADYLVFKYKDPALRMPRVEIKPERSPATLYPVVGPNDLGYRYTFKRRPQNIGSAISKEFHVESEKGSMTPDDVSITWELSPAEPQFWILNTSTLETGANVARLGY